jgi:hypothetical protein
LAKTVVVLALRLAGRCEGGEVGAADSRARHLVEPVGETHEVNGGGRRCRHCKAAAVEPPLLTIDARNLHDWFLCEACWLLLEIGFSDARPYDDLYRYLSPIEGRLSDTEVYHHILRGRVLLKRPGGLWRTGKDLRGTESIPD